MYKINNLRYCCPVNQEINKILYLIANNQFMRKYEIPINFA